MATQSGQWYRKKKIDNDENGWKKGNYLDRKEKDATRTTIFAIYLFETIKKRLIPLFNLLFFFLFCHFRTGETLQKIESGEERLDRGR